MGWFLAAENMKTRSASAPAITRTYARPSRIDLSVRVNMSRSYDPSPSRCPVTDTSTQPTAPTIPAPAGGLVSPTLGSSVSAVSTSAPELTQSPGLVVGVASSGGDTTARAQAVARGTGAIANSNAQDRVATAPRQLGAAMN